MVVNRSTPGSYAAQENLKPVSAFSASDLPCEACAALQARSASPSSTLSWSSRRWGRSGIAGPTAKRGRRGRRQRSCTRGFASSTSRPPATNRWQMRTARSGRSSTGRSTTTTRFRRSLRDAGTASEDWSDTEVLPHLYEEHGDEMFDRLRGMFAIAILDRRRRRLVLLVTASASSRSFTLRTENTVAFASEINALRAFPGVDLTPDPQAIADFAGLLFVPAPHTIHRGVSALQPGEILDCRLGTRRARDRDATTVSRIQRRAERRGHARSGP